MKKHQIRNLAFDSLQTRAFGGPYHLGVILDQNIYRDKRFLELNFREGLFYAKVPNSKKFIYPPLEQHDCLRVTSDQK
jgi:hypothetical protein